MTRDLFLFCWPPVCFYTVSFQFKLIPTIFCCHLTDYNASNHISGAAIDLSSLIVVEGKVCWDLYIDGLVVSSDGNLLDALAAAIKVSVDLYWLFLAIFIVIFFATVPVVPS